MKKQLFLIALVLLFVATMVQAQNRETRQLSTFTQISFRVPGKLYLRQGSPQKVEVEGKSDVLKETKIDVEGSKLVITKPGRWQSIRWDNDEQINVYITVENIEAVNLAGSGDIIGETKIVGNNIDLSVSGSGNMKIEVEASANLNANLSGSGDLTVNGKCRSFDSSVSGSGKLDLVLNASGNAEFGISGSGKVSASGSASSVKASISGSGKVLAGDLKTNKCDVRISGSGDVEINVNDELNTTISGSGSVSYHGNPSKINSHASGSGHVRKL